MLALRTGLRPEADGLWAPRSLPTEVTTSADSALGVVLRSPRQASSLGFPAPPHAGETAVWPGGALTGEARPGTAVLGNRGS